VSLPTPEPAAVAAFWALARPALGLVGPVPEAWAFGGTPEQADELLALVLAGAKTATASALWDYEAESDPLPEVGRLDIVLDGRGRPRALLRTTDVAVQSFDEVSADHAYREGEGDRSLAYWRRVHEDFFTRYASHDRGFSPAMPVVLQSFEVLFTG
jgi:uncharacterized protein YhfF